MEVGKTELLWDYIKSCVWKLWKLLSTVEFKESLIQLKKKEKNKESIILIICELLSSRLYYLIK